jgi:hypothetical protein
MSKWCGSEEYGGKVRKVTFRSLCHSPLCPPDTAVTEWQHASFSKDKRNLVTILRTNMLSANHPFPPLFKHALLSGFRFMRQSSRHMMSHLVPTLRYLASAKLTLCKNVGNASLQHLTYISSRDQN